MDAQLAGVQQRRYHLGDQRHRRPDIVSCAHADRESVYAREIRNIRGKKTRWLRQGPGIEREGWNHIELRPGSYAARKDPFDILGVVFAEVVLAFDGDAHSHVQWIFMVLIQDVVRRHELDGPSELRRRPVDANGQFIGNAIAETKRSEREVVQAEQLPAAARSGKRGIVREAMGEVDVEPVLIDGAAGRKAEQQVVAGFVDRAGLAEAFLRLPGRRTGASSAAATREGTDVSGETGDLRVR